MNACARSDDSLSLRHMAIREPTSVEISTEDSHPVRGDLYLPGELAPQGIVLLCHGFKGYKTWGFFPYVARRLQSTGIAALSLDMSLNGTFPRRDAAPDEDPNNEPTTPRRYVRPDLFERNTVSRECRDVAAAIRFTLGHGLGDSVTMPLPIGLFGYSRGGVSTILNAIEWPAVRALCTWSTVDHPDFFTHEQKEKWRKRGRYDFVDAIDGSRLSVGLAYLEDLEAKSDYYNLEERVKELRMPHLIVHGEVDLVVDVKCALKLYESQKNRTETRLLVLQTGHTFGMPYPVPDGIDDAPRALERATNETVEWFRAHLKGDAAP